MHLAKRVVFQLVAVAVLSTGFAQFSVAGFVSSSQVINAEIRDQRISRIQTLVASADVTDKLRQYGVAPEMVAERMQNLTDAELVMLESTIDEQVAGGDAVAVIGVVFIVLMILELVGVTDIFKAF